MTHRARGRRDASVRSGNGAEAASREIHCDDAQFIGVASLFMLEPALVGAGEHFGEAHRDCEISGATPPPAPWPSTSAKRAGLAGCSYARAGPPAVSTWDVSERVRVWTVAAGLAAVVEAAYRTLTHYFPAASTTLDPLYAAALAAIPDGRFAGLLRVGGTGLEPVTPSLSSWCSPN